MRDSEKKSDKDFAKIMVAACVRRSLLEDIHAGKAPVTRTGDYSDVKVIDANGREIPWNEVSRISQDEMKSLMIEVVNQTYTFLCRALFSPNDSPDENQAFFQALERSVAAEIKKWNEPEFLPKFFMPSSEFQK